MIAFCPPPVFPSYGWPLEDPIPNQQIYFSRENENNNSTLGQSFHNYLQSHPPDISKLDPSTSFTDYTGDPNMVKKLNHNASERDRRKKMNCLFSSLRSLLPAADQMKLSIPATVSRVLKYIPELQKEVEMLLQKKEEILSEISKQDKHLLNHIAEQRKSNKKSSGSSVVSATQLSDTEIVIQISTHSNNVHTITPFSEIILHLQEEGFVLINSSSFESSGGRVFYNLLLQMEGTQRLESEALRQKLVSLYERRKGMFL
ncbi:transcription factor ORG2 isoform X2 [Jatropha curcas]|uniref:transcription factor ORG2 isoform X2 n=1 Tax=Jatropha curcas TaxID=180498 RepID=UPI0005FC10AE|nr:transcription factor ORG2 isoform X2 [Jatropha curcas]